MGRLFIASVAALCMGCAGPPRAPTVVEVLPSGYRVDGTAAASTAELRDYLRARKVRDVRIVPLIDSSDARLQEAFGALRDLDVAIVP